MRPVFDAQARVQYDNGLLFYEKDMVKLDYELNGTTEITAEIDYFSAGFGIAFEKLSSSPLRQGEDTYLIKLGSDTFSVFRKEYNKQERLVYTTCDYRPVHEKSKLIFTKNGSTFEVYHEEKLLGQFVAPSDFGRYAIYIYSNAGNRVHYVSVNGTAPDAWVTNIENTNGGRIEFTENQIRIENCEKDAEVEQHDIFLEEGKYYLDYELVSGNVEPVVFLSSDSNFKDEKKNLLNADGSFVTEEDAFVSVKFKSSDCVIQNIAIKESKGGTYVPTGEVPKRSFGSYFDIILDSVKKVRWKGVIHAVPATEGLLVRHSLIESSIKRYVLSEGSVLIGQELSYEFDVMTMTLTVHDMSGNKRSTLFVEAAYDEVYVRVFKNLDATISELIVTDSDGQEINMILQETYKSFVPTSVKSPILCLNENDEPLDLSSSFREMVVDGITEYIFTNWEREYFYPVETFELEKSLKKDVGNVVIYGIKGEHDWEGIYKIEKGVNDVTGFAKNSVMIHPQFYEVDIDNNLIVVDEEIMNMYDLFIVDYLKEASYCINLNRELNMYEVDVSISDGKAKVTYDYSEGEYEGASTQYKVVGINPIISQYIILQEGMQ